MKISNRHRRTYSLAVFCALTSVFLILNGCGDDDDGGGVPLKVTYSISGQTTLDNGSELSGVTMTLGGVSTATTTTDSGGFYTFTGLDNGIYTITPTRTGYTFSPTSSQQTVSGANISGVHFTATQVQAGSYSISGQVTSNGSGLSSVTMTLTGASSDNVITDASGNYAFTGLDNGSYTITPSKTGFTISPTFSPQTVSGADITSVNFTTTAGPPGPPSALIVQCPLSVATNVTIQDNVFTPDNVTINANGIVKWTNNGPSPHTVLSGDPWGYSADIYESPVLGTGDTFCVQFQGTGTSQYACTIHPAMVGSVVVQ
jgi:inhibitor of cysteine peptidase